MSVDNFKLVDDARLLLGLDEETTIDEIKKAYKSKINKYHPDKNSEDSEAHWKTIEIIKAYEILVKYCQNYKFSFKEEDYVEQDPKAFDKTTDADYMKWWQKQYGSDPLWGGGYNSDA